MSNGTVETIATDRSLAPFASPRLQVKYFVEGNVHVEPHTLIEIFQEWIRDRVMDELLIDVADYSHVHEGPGVVLIGHGADYYFDSSRGRPGLLYNRKRAFEGDGSARLLDALRRVTNACSLLERDARLNGTVKFDPSEVLIRVPDRLRAPNDARSFEAAQPTLTSVLERVYGRSNARITHEGTLKDPFSARVHAERAPQLDALLASLATTSTSAGGSK